MMITCPKCETIYDEEKYTYCPKCREQYEFDNGPWKVNR